MPKSRSSGCRLARRQFPSLSPYEEATAYTVHEGDSREGRAAMTGKPGSHPNTGSPLSGSRGWNDRFLTLGGRARRFPRRTRYREEIGHVILIMNKMNTPWTTSIQVPGQVQAWAGPPLTARGRRLVTRRRPTPSPAAHPLLPVTPHRAPPPGSFAMGTPIREAVSGATDGNQGVQRIACITHTHTSRMPSC